MKHAHILDYWFKGDENPPVVGSADGSFWRSLTVETGGSPSVKTNNGFMELDLDATAESQSACLYAGDELAFDIAKLQTVEIWAKMSASLDAQISAAFGVCGAIGSDPDSLVGAWFRLYGNNLILAESDDGTNDNDDVATGQSLSTTVRRFCIDFASGVTTLVPPPSKGGRANTLFSCDNAQGNLMPVARGTTFDLSGLTGGVQPFALIQKGLASSAAGAVEATLSIERFRLAFKS